MERELAALGEVLAQEYTVTPVQLSWTGTPSPASSPITVPLT
jgi:hypothetical protein